MRSTLITLILILGFTTAAIARDEPRDTITVATYNIENLHRNFMGHRMGTTQPALPVDDERVLELLEHVKRKNDEDNWQIASVILDPKFNPDVLVIQEGCRQEDLEFFNTRWLGGAYETLVTFPTNTTRDQHLNVMLKPGFKIVERKDQYHLEPDPVPNPRGERLFARGPAFALIEAPSGYRFWVGTTHQKSKGGNNREMTEWRNREAKRTRQIMQELVRSGATSDLILLGDMNDEPGYQEYELDGGGDVIANLVGPEGDGFILATKPLVDQGKQSFGGYFNDRFRSFIDHVVISKDVADQVEEVKVIDWGLAPVASDHYPVMIRIRPDERK